MSIDRKDFSLNLIGQMSIFIINMSISLLLTPYIVGVLGTESFGYIGIINNIISYLTILTTALNALAGRYVTISYLQKDTKNTNEYFNSVFFSNLFLSIVIFILSLFMSLKLEYILHIPEYLISDVKIAFLLAAMSSSISLLSVVWGIAAFIKNKLFLNSFANAVAGIIRIVLLISLFSLFTPCIYYYSIAGVIFSLVVLAVEFIVTKKMMPEIELKRMYFSFKKVLELIKNGVWVSLESLNKILQTGLDLIVTNIFVNPISTGLFSIAKQIPVAIFNIPALLANVFNPTLARLYVKGNKDELVDYLYFTMKFLTFAMIIPLMGFVVYGDVFYKLWLPNNTAEEISTIQILSVLTLLPYIFDTYVQGLYYINVLTNKIKKSVLITFVFSVASIITEFVLLLTTDIDPLLVIATTSSVYISIRYLFVTPIYCAHILDIKKFTFFKQLIKSVSISFVVAAFFLIIKNVLIFNTWGTFAISVLIAGGLGYIIVFLINFTKEEKKKVISMLKLNRFLRRREK